MKIKTLLKFVREGHLVKCKNPIIEINLKPDVGDILFLSLKVDNNSDIVLNDSNSIDDDFILKPFKVYQVIHTSHLSMGNFSEYDLIVSLNMEHFDLMKLSEDLKLEGEAVKKNKFNRQ